MPHNLAWHDWEMRTRVQRAHREVEQMRRTRRASEPSGVGKNGVVEGLLTRLRGLASLGAARTAPSAKGV